MPPKKTVIKNKANCGWRDVTPLREYANDPSKVKTFLAKILDDNEYLDNYKLVPNLNECVLSYPAKTGTDSHEWFGVYLQDSDGNKSWTYTGPNGNKITKNYVYYFKTVLGEDGEYEIDTNSHSFTVPPQLVGLKPCEIGKNGKCSVPQKETTPKKEPKTPKATNGGRAEAVPVVEIPTAELVGAVEALNINEEPEEEQVKGSIPQEDLAKLDEKTIIKWMAEHMYFEDVAKCLRSSKLSSEESQRIAQLVQEGKAAVVPERNVEQAAAQAARNMPSAEVRKMFKAISKKELTDEINKISNMNDRKQAIVQLCQRAGLNYTYDMSSKIPKILSPDGKTTRPETALDDCARTEARQAHVELANRIERASGRARKIVAGKYPPYTPSATPVSGGPMTTTQATIVSEFIDDLLDLIKNDEYDNFIAAVKNTGLNAELREDGIYYNDVYVDLESEEMDNLIDEAALAYIKKFKVAFGGKRFSTFGMTKARRCKVRTSKKMLKVSKVRSNFKCAVRTCRKSKNYRVCMKKELRRIYRKRKSSMGENCGCDKKKQIPTFGKKRKVSKAVKIFKAASKKCKGKSNYRKCFTSTLRKMHGTSFGKKKRAKGRSSMSLTGAPKMSATAFNKTGKHYMKGTNGKYFTITPVGETHGNNVRWRWILSPHQSGINKKKIYRGRSSFGKGKKPTPRNKSMKFKVRTNSTRKSPRISATSVSVGTIRKGINGKFWKVKKTKTGIKRWVKM